MDDDIIEPKTEQQQSVPPKTEPTDDELLPPDPETAVVITLADGQPTSTTIEEFSDGAVQQSCDTKDSVVTCNAQSTTTTISESDYHPYCCYYWFLIPRTLIFFQISNVFLNFVPNSMVPKFTTIDIFPVKFLKFATKRNFLRPIYNMRKRRIGTC